MMDNSADHDALIRLEGQVTALVAQTAANNVALVAQMAANNVASIDRDTRTATAVEKINGKVADQEVRLHPLERDRSIWNWVIRVCILGTPIAVVVANYLTKA